MIQKMKNVNLSHDTAPAVIGTTELVVLPGNSDEPIPAKVDTGADGSAVWATEIIEQDGELSFVLFAPNSSFYTGKVHKTKRYRVTRVKNSFGIDEYRYRVWMTVIVASKRYNASFTLANRANNRYPILIGKRFLKNRFLVDVSRSNLVTAAEHISSGSILVLTGRATHTTAKFFDEVGQLADTNIIVASYRDLSYEIQADGEPRIALPDGTDIATMRLVYFKSYHSHVEYANTIARYLNYRHVHFIDRELDVTVARSKISASFALAVEHIPVPPMYLESNEFAGQTYRGIASRIGEKFVLKEPFSDRGNNNFLVSDQVTYDEAMRRLEGAQSVVVQRYIENDGFYRVLVMGREVAQVIYRASVDHDDPLKQHLNKPHGSANATELDPSDYDSEMVTMCIRAALALKRNVAGVDVMRDRQTGQWYVMEVNNNPVMIKGINVKHKQQALATLLKKESMNA